MRDFLHRTLRWPLRGLFLQIFLWFWLSMLAVLFAATLAVLVAVDPVEFVSQRKALFEELELTGQVFSNVVEKDPSRPWAEALQQARRSSYSSLYLLSAERQSLQGKQLPEIVAELHGDALYSDEPQIRVGDGLVVVGPYQFGVGGERFQIYLTKERPRLYMLRALGIVTRHSSMVVMALLVSVALCLLLAAWLVRPIRALQQASRRIALGELSARVTESVSWRRDELGELGRDFDRMAEQLDELLQSKERLLRDVSHELRSPLTRLQLALALARGKAKGLAEREHDRIELEVVRLNTVIGNIIEWSRMAAKPGQQNFRPLALRSLVQTLVSDTDYEARAKGLGGVELVAERELYVQGNAEMLRSVVENIVRNAIRFTPPGELISLQLTAAEYKGRPGAEIRIRDRGPGVPDEALDVLFEPFFRVDATRGQENSGSGLGMAIAQRLVEYHGGRIWAANDNPGLLVTIQLPLSETPAARGEIA